MLLKKYFDALIVLSNPRASKALPFAFHLAQQLPIYFVQPDAQGDEVLFDGEIEGVTIVHMPATYVQSVSEALAAALLRRGVIRPLLWIYNPLFQHYVNRTNALLKIFNATEDFLIAREHWGIPAVSKHKFMDNFLTVDLIVAESTEVLESYVSPTEYTGQTLVLGTAYDTRRWIERGAADYQQSSASDRVAFYHGAISDRLDFSLLIEVTVHLPDWQFWFCGPCETESTHWRTLQTRPNVSYFGDLPPDGIASKAKLARVGLIPLSLKHSALDSVPSEAYEYVAFGLPVVSVPITGLYENPRLFCIAYSSREFAFSIVKVAESRTNLTELQYRLDAAAGVDYQRHFEILCGRIGDTIERRLLRKLERYNICILYDPHAMHVATTREHLYAFRDYSQSDIVFMPATHRILGLDDVDQAQDFTAFDAVVLHYSVRLSFADFISAGIAAGLVLFNGPKFLFIQDEYENTETARRWIEKLAINVIFTVVPLQEIEKVYPRGRFPNVEFISTLTGYVPEDASLDKFSLPLSDRSVLIGYRGRPLPFHYGALGREKYNIGVDVRRIAESRRLAVDIEVEHEHRIYGDSWYRFLGSCRATLGTESGSNVFDDYGELKRLAAVHSDLDFEEFSRRFLGPYEGEVRMNQISPKIFEAIRLRTALVLFEGEYSGVVAPGKHFIPLKKDYSNIDDVFSMLRSDEFISEITTRAYNDVILSGKYSYQSFMSVFLDRLKQRLLNRRPRARFISSPIMAFYNSWDVDGLWPKVSLRGLTSGSITGSESLEMIVRGASELIPESNRHRKASKTALFNVARAQDGAFVYKSSAFYPRPNDADYLLRPEVEGGYAAALDGIGMPQFIEIDLGKVRAIDSIKLLWYSDENFGRDYTFEARTELDEHWHQLLSVKENLVVEHLASFPAVAARYLRLTVSRVFGQQRILLRGLAVGEAGH